MCQQIEYLLTVLDPVISIVKSKQNNVFFFSFNVKLPSSSDKTAAATQVHQFSCSSARTHFLPIVGWLPIGKSKHF